MIIAAWEAPQTVAAIVGGLTAMVALLGIWINGLRAERQRRREVYADALVTTFAYREFAYVVRRRRHDAPSEERTRISESLREIQRDLSRHQALMKIERCRDVAAKYEHLVAKTREVAGGYMHEGWKAPAATNDAQMNIGDIDYSTLSAFEDAYLKAVANDLSAWRFWR